jgi:hypothetical protein
VTAEAKVREGDELRHHARVSVVEVVMGLGRVQRSRFLRPADHTVAVIVKW